MKAYMNWQRRIGRALLSTNLLLAVGQAQASKPLSERSAEACEALANAAEQEKIRHFSPSVLAPLHVVLGSTKCAKVAERWRQGDAYDRRFPTAGLLEMFKTAEIAAQDIIESLEIKNAVQPVYNRNSPYEGAAATLELLEAKKPPAYIRNAVLIRDNVLMVVPLLKRMRVQDKDTGKPLYAPIITKGHQELHEFDVLSAAFAAWALEKRLGKLPEKAFVYLRPMEKRRTSEVGSEGPELFEINPEHYLPKVMLTVDGFKSIARDENRMQEVAADARRCTHCSRCPWANFCKKQFKAQQDLSMIPFPPTPEQAAKLKAMGYRSLLDLAALDVNSPEFIETALRAEIKTEKLNYYVARALATKLGKPFVYSAFADPIRTGQSILHTDFEDLMNGKLISGVYLFGMKFEEEGKVESRKAFIFANDLEQAPIDEAWAKFVRAIKGEYALTDDYSVVIYSKHEQSKIEQEFDMRRRPVSKFTRKEKKSPFYFESGTGKNKVGRLIRRTEFFDKYPDISPQDIFAVMERILDLLPFFRKNIASPGYTNSIKAILPLVQGDDLRLQYAEGQNGLESRDWANRAYATGEEELFEKIRTYNEIDIEATSALLGFLRQYAGETPLKQVDPSPTSQDRFVKVNAVIKFKKVAAELATLSETFEKALGHKLSSIAPEAIQELMTTLNRTEYLARLKNISEDALSDGGDDRSERQATRFDHTQERAIFIRDWFEKQNPEIFADIYSPATEALVEIMDIPHNLLTPSKLSMVLAFEELAPIYAAAPGILPERIDDSFDVPEEWMALVSHAPSFADGPEGQDMRSYLRLTARALYFKQRFSSQNLGVNLKEWVESGGEESESVVVAE